MSWRITPKVKRSQGFIDQKRGVVILLGNPPVKNGLVPWIRPSKGGRRIEALADWVVEELERRGVTATVLYDTQKIRWMGRLPGVISPYVNDGDILVYAGGGTWRKTVLTGALRDWGPGVNHFRATFCGKVVTVLKFDLDLEATGADGWCAQYEKQLNWVKTECKLPIS